MHARPPKRRRGLNVDQVLAALVITVGSLAGFGIYLVSQRSPERVSLQQGCPGGMLLTNEAQQPSYTLHSSYLPAHDFQKLQAELLHRRPIMLASHFEQGLNAVNINFNLAGMEKLAEEDSEEFPVAPLVPLFVERLRLERASAWSLNVVFSQPRGVQRAGHSGPQDAHVDNLGLQGDGQRCSLYSYQTSVLYLFVPQDMVGGNLSILQPPSFTTQVATIVPQENLLVTFRGDQAHRVEEFQSGSMRVSLTLEQYLVPANLYWATTGFTAKRLRY